MRYDNLKKFIFINREQFYIDGYKIKDYKPNLKKISCKYNLPLIKHYYLLNSSKYDIKRILFDLEMKDYEYGIELFNKYNLHDINIINNILSYFI